MSPKKTSDMAWDHEFDVLDEEIGGRIHLNARTHISAVRRAGKSTFPSPKLPPIRDILANRLMPDIPLTRHAAHRLKNRGISLSQVLMVTSFAKPQRVHGATRYALDRGARELLKTTMPPEELRRLKSLDIVAVVSDDGQLITASHRTARLRRDISFH